MCNIHILSFTRHLFYLHVIQKPNTTEDILKNSLSPLHPALVVGDVFSVEKLVGWRVFAQAMFRRRARVHEGLSHHRQTGVCNAVLMDVKDKLRVFNHIDPKPQGKAVRETERDVITSKIKQTLLETVMLKCSVKLSCQQRGFKTRTSDVTGNEVKDRKS